MDTSQTNTTFIVTETRGGFDTQTATVVVLSTILIVLLICLPIVLIQLYRNRPRRSVTGDENINTSHGRIKLADDTYKAMNKTDKKLEEAKDMVSVNTVDVNVLDEDSKHVYETVRDSTHIYNNLSLRQDDGCDKVDVYVATRSRIMAESRPTTSVPLGNAERGFAGIHRQKKTATQRFIESGVAMEATEGYETLPLDRELNNIYLDPDYLDMSTATRKYNTIQPKRKKRGHVGSLYQKQQPGKPNLNKYGQWL